MELLSYLDLGLKFRSYESIRIDLNEKVTLNVTRN
jgi:hypothetical protein